MLHMLSPKDEISLDLYFDLQSMQFYRGILSTLSGVYNTEIGNAPGVFVT